MFAVLLAVVGVGLLGVGLHSLWLLPVAWLGLDFIVVAIGYLVGTPYVFGKSAEGTISWWSLILLWPYRLVLATLWWLLVCFGKTSAVSRYGKDLYLSRRLRTSEMPEDIDLYLDLTAEVSDPQAIRSDGRYVCLPILDRGVPTVTEMDELLKKIGNKRVLIHCAQGSGRTGLVALAVMAERGHSDTYDDALRQLRDVRPIIQLSREQERFVKRYYFGGDPPTAS